MSQTEHPPAAADSYRTSNAQPVGRVAEEEFSWNGMCRGWRLTSHDALQVDLEEMPPGTHEVLHAHQHAIQFYFVLRGKAVVQLGDRKVAVDAGTGVEIMPRVPHQISNHSNAPLEFLVVSSRPPRGDRIDLPAEPCERKSWS